MMSISPKGNIMHSDRESKNDNDLELLRQECASRFASVQDASTLDQIRLHLALMEEQLGHLNGFLLIKDFRAPELDDYLRGNVFGAGRVLCERLESLLKRITTVNDSMLALESLCCYVRHLAYSSVIRHGNCEEVHW